MAIKKISLTFKNKKLKNSKNSTQEAFEKCWAHSPLRVIARPFTRCRYCRTPALSHAACASMSTTTTPTTTTTTTTRDRGDHYGPKTKDRRRLITTIRTVEGTVVW